MGTFYAPNDYRNYIAHYGVKGMKWGVRKKRPSIGSMIHRLRDARLRRAARKKEAAAVEAVARRKRQQKINSEVRRLFKQNPALNGDFGGPDMVDDEEFLSYIARTEYGMNTDALDQALSEGRRRR